MANGNGNGNGNGSINWRAWGGTLSIGGIASVVLAFSINTAKDAQIALQVAGQHGTELNELRAEVRVLRNDMRDRTKLRYTSADAAKDYSYINQRLLRCERHIETLK